MGAKQQGPRLRVLVADHNHVIQRAVVRQLQDAFELVGVVSTGRELVAAVRSAAAGGILSRECHRAQILMK